MQTENAHLKVYSRNGELIESHALREITIEGLAYVVRRRPGIIVKLIYGGQAITVNQALWGVYENICARDQVRGLHKSTPSQLRSRDDSIYDDLQQTNRPAADVASPDDMVKRQKHIESLSPDSYDDLELAFAYTPVLDLPRSTPFHTRVEL
jgi:hypothetical protein